MINTARLKNRIIQHRLSAGVTMVISGEQTVFHLLILERKKEEIEITKVIKNINDLDQLVEEFPASVPIQLCINGRGVLHKKIPNNSDQQLIQSVLPNANPDQFYLQKRVASTGVVCSIIRRQTLDELITKIQQKGLWITSVSVGLFEVASLWKYLDKPNFIQTINTQINFNNNGQIESFSSVSELPQEEVSLGGDTIHSDLLPSYSLALKYMLKQRGSDINTPAINNSNEEYEQKIIFDKSWRYVLAFLAVILVINTSFFYYYKNKNKKLMGSSAYVLNQISELDTLKSRIERHKDLVKLTSVNQSTDLSYYADQIGQTLLKDLKLIELDIFPLQGKAKDYDKESLLKYDRQKIQVTGHCSNSLTYNKWINELEQLEWVSRVEHLDYKDLTKNLAAFELSILIEPGQ